VADPPRRAVEPVYDDLYHEHRAQLAAGLGMPAIAPAQQDDVPVDVDALAARTEALIGEVREVTA
jgi:hypothetical protein